MRAQDKYNKANTIVINIRLIKSTETDIIEQLKKQPNKSGYIKALIRAEIKNKKEN